MKLTRMPMTKKHNEGFFSCFIGLLEVFRLTDLSSCSTAIIVALFS